MTACHDYTSRMIRTQIQITEEQSRRLRAMARQQGISLAEAIRRCLDRVLVSESPGLPELYAGARRCVGAFRDREGAADLSEEHDRYLGEASG
jgi:hypothetical protein